MNAVPAYYWTLDADQRAEAYTRLARDQSVLDNALVQQKDTLIRLIDTPGIDGKEQAMVALDLNAPLWAALNYGYKTGELRRRLRDAVRFEIEECKHSRKVCERLVKLAEQLS